MAIEGRKVRVGVIGCGQIAQTHFANYAEIEDVEVVACADIDPAAADKSAAKFGIPNVYYTAKAMMERDDLDAIDVCLHNNYHVSGAVAVMESGRDCYCEKPMAGSYRDAQTMLDTSKRLGKKLHIQLAHLYSDEARAAKELIDDGQLGKIYHARSTGFRRRGRPYVDGYGKPSFVRKPVSGGGALFDMGVYHISEMLYLMGNPEVERVSGKTYQELPMDEGRRVSGEYSVEELGLGLVHFKGGATLDIIEAWAIQLGGMEESCIVGSKGGIRLRPFSFHTSVGYLDLDSTANLGATHYLWRKVKGDGDYYSSSQGHWIAALQGKVPLLPTAEIGLTTALISESIYLSQIEGREVTVEEVRKKSISKAIAL